MPCGIWWAHDENMVLFSNQNMWISPSDPENLIPCCCCFFSPKQSNLVLEKKPQAWGRFQLRPTFQRMPNASPKKSWSRAAENLEFGGTRNGWLNLRPVNDVNLVDRFTKIKLDKTAFWGAEPSVNASYLLKLTQPPGPLASPRRLKSLQAHHPEYTSTHSALVPLGWTASTSTAWHISDLYRSMYTWTYYVYNYNYIIRIIYTYIRLLYMCIYVHILYAYLNWCMYI